MHVDCVASAYRALESLRLAPRDGRTYDVAILDHQMPDMDGIMLARTIKSDRALAAIPLVPLTSVSYGGCAAEAKEAGFSAFLIKPIRQSQLYDCIASVMHIAGESAPQRLITQETLPETQSRSRVLVAEDNAVWTWSRTASRPSRRWPVSPTIAS
jgi:CheY-like chemotaxis protein